MHEGALLLSSDGVILYANNRFSEMVGLPLEQLINSPLRKFIPVSDRAACKSLLADGIRERCSDEITLRGAGRKTFDVRVSCTPFLLDEKPCVCAVLTDISETKKYLQIIEEGRLAQAVIQQANDCIIICDTQGIILQASNIFHRYSPRAPCQ